MNSYDPDRLRAELNAAPAPAFDDDLADRAADDMRMVASGDRALVFLAEDGAIRYILVTPLGSDGKLEHLQGC